MEGTCAHKQCSVNSSTGTAYFLALIFEELLLYSQAVLLCGPYSSILVWRKL